MACISCLMLGSLAACGNGGSDNHNAAVTGADDTAGGDRNEGEPADNLTDMPESDSALYENGALEPGTDSELQADLYAGEYNDYDVNEPYLEIQKNDDGTYTIQVGIFRLVQMNDGEGRITDKGIEFSATAPDGKVINGIITVEGDIAAVTLTSPEWSTYSSINEYQYHKTSDIPNISEH